MPSLKPSPLEGDLSIRSFLPKKKIGTLPCRDRGRVELAVVRIPFSIVHTTCQQTVRVRKGSIGDCRRVCNWAVVARRVAEQTVASRQLLSDQVSALTKSKLKSDLDLSFANVNLAQAKLLYLDALNNDKAAMASLSAILGYPNLQNFELASDTVSLTAPPADVDRLIADALAKRPELLALEFESESGEKLHRARRDEMLPTISALAAYGDSPVRDDRVYGPYAAVGVNLQIPVFNGFLYSARSREADLRAQAMRQRLSDLRNRISRDVRTSWLSASTAFDRVNVSQQLLAQANLALDLAQTRYKLGLSSIVELSQAQLQQTQAEIANAQAESEYRLALSVLRYQTGSL